jgi:hypothetical protein
LVVAVVVVLAYLTLLELQIAVGPVEAAAVFSISRWQHPNSARQKIIQLQRLFPAELVLAEMAQGVIIQLSISVPTQPL